jgi:hypothetical protein
MCAVALWHRLLGRPASENGTLCRGAGGHEGGTRRRRVLMLPILSFRPTYGFRAAVFGPCLSSSAGCRSAGG